MQRSFPDDVRQFVDTVTWTFAKTYARTWPHEYIVRRPDNAHLVNGATRTRPTRRAWPRGRCRARLDAAETWNAKEGDKP